MGPFNIFQFYCYCIVSLLLCLCASWNSVWYKIEMWAIWNRFTQQVTLTGYDKSYIGYQKQVWLYEQVSVTRTRMCVTVDWRRLIFFSVNALNGFSRCRIVMAPHMLWSPVWLSYCTLWLFVTPSTHFLLDYCVSSTWQNGGCVFGTQFVPKKMGNCDICAPVVDLTYFSSHLSCLRWVWVELTFVTRFKCSPRLYHICK